MIRVNILYHLAALRSRAVYRRNRKHAGQVRLKIADGSHVSDILNIELLIGGRLRNSCSIADQNDEFFDNTGGYALRSISFDVEFS